MKTIDNICCDAPPVWMFCPTFYIEQAIPFAVKKGISSTFHGRDIFAPVAAWLSKGIEFHHFGHTITDYRKLDIPEIERGHGIIKGKVIYIDRFGNIITNFTPKDIDDVVKNGIPASNICTRIERVEITGINKYYAEVNKGEPGTIFNSFGLFEIYAYMDDAAKMLGVRKGAVVELKSALP